MSHNKLALIKEKDGVRGLVPSRKFGTRDKVYGSYLEKLDPRTNEHVRGSLAQSEDPRFLEFLDRVSIPRYRKVALQTIAKACNISLMEFNNWWQKASAQAAIATAQRASIDITEDLVEDARSVQVACERCDGMTWVSAPPGLPDQTPGYKQISGSQGEPLFIRDCPVCTNGKVRKPGDTHARDRVLEMSGLIQKGKTGVQIIQNFGGASHSSAVTDLDVMTLDVQCSEVD